MSKLDWMYKSSNSVDPEEYLLGKAIDKNFEKQSSHNEIDKDILPTSIFAKTSNEAQVDVFRKIKEDPLEQIKQKEMEMRKQLLKNPVKLRKLQNLLKAKEEKKKLKDDERKKNEDLDALLLKKCMKLMQKHGAKSLDELVSDTDSDEDKKRKKKNKKGQSDSESDSGVGRRTSRKELSKRSKKRSEAPRKRSRSSSCDVQSRRAKSRRSRERDDSHSENKRKDRHKSKRRSPESDSEGDVRDHRKKGKKRNSTGDDELITNLIAKYGVKMLMDATQRDDDSGEERTPKKKKNSKSSRRDSSPEDERKVRPSERFGGQSKSKGKLRRSPSSDSVGDSKRHSSKKKLKRKDSHRKLEDRHRRSSSVSESDKSPEVEEDHQNPSRTRRDVDYSSEEERRKASKRSYGLVLPKGIDPKKSSSKSRPEPEMKKKVEPDSKPQFKRSKPTKLTEEEKEARLKEMMANAQWRDKERSTRVKRYKEEEKKELEQTKKYDDSFVRNELAKAASKSVEERIKSNINNLQRSKFSMNEHFARRT